MRPKNAYIQCRARGGSDEEAMAAMADAAEAIIVRGRVAAAARPLPAGMDDGEKDHHCRYCCQPITKARSEFFRAFCSNRCAIDKYY